MKTLGPIQNIEKIQTGLGKVQGPGRSSGDESFKNTLEALKAKASQEGLAGQAPSELKFSGHAVDRMRLRGLHFGPEDLTKIESALEKARAKGAENTLVIGDKAAMIVSVKNNTVVTVMDKSNLKENVFTNIDSTVMI